MLGMILGPDGLVVVVVLAIVLLFGGKKLPSLARGLGSAAHEFKKGTDEGDTSLSELPKSSHPLEHDLKGISDSIGHLPETSLLHPRDDLRS